MKKSPPPNLPSDKNSGFSWLPRADTHMIMDDGTSVQMRTCRAYVHVRFVRKGKVYSFAALGISTIERQHILLSRDLAEVIVSKLATAKTVVERLAKAKKKSKIVNIPAIVMAGMKLAIDKGTQEIVLPVDMLDGLAGIDASFDAVSANIKGAFSGRDIRVCVYVSDDVVLDVTSVAWPSQPKWPSKPKSKSTARRPVSKTAN